MNCVQRPGQLIVISGPSAAGKTTVGRHLATQFERALHLDGDQIQNFVVAGAIRMDEPAPPGAVEQLLLRYRAAVVLAALYQGSGFDVVVTDNAFEDGLLHLLSYATDKSPGDVFFVMLDPSVEAIWNRYNQRPGGGYSQSLTPEVLKLAVTRSPQLGLRLDTSDQTHGETTAEILRLPAALVTSTAVDQFVAP